jgi:hypothetical protein
MKRLVPAFPAILTLVLVLLAACVPVAAPAAAPSPAPPTPAPAADLVAPAKAFVAAMNAGNVDAALALFAEDTRLDAFGSPARGKEASRAVLDWLVAREVQQQIADCRPQADRVACTASYADGCSAASGLPSDWSMKLVFVYQPDGKIKQAFLSHEAPLPEDVGSFWMEWLDWVRANRSGDLYKVNEDDGEGGKLLVKLCREYAATLTAGN